MQLFHVCVKRLHRRKTSLAIHVYILHFILSRGNSTYGGRNYFVDAEEINSSEHDLAKPSRIGVECEKWIRKFSWFCKVCDEFEPPLHGGFYLIPLGRAAVAVLPSYLEVPPVIDIGSRTTAKESGSTKRKLENQRADGKLTVPATAGAVGEPMVGATQPALPVDPMTGLPSGVPVSKVRDRKPGAPADGDENINGKEITGGEDRDQNLQDAEEDTWMNVMINRFQCHMSMRWAKTMYCCTFCWMMSRMSPGSRGGRWPMKTPPRDPCKRTCGTLVTHLGAYKSQLVVTIVPYIYM